MDQGGNERRSLTCFSFAVPTMADPTTTTTSPNDDNPKTPAKRKPSGKPTNVPNGPLAAALARKAAASPRTPANRKSSAPTTPKSAPARPRKAAEPTLLGDFLLGRPSPARQKKRRQSLDAVKKEMRAEVVAQVRAPGKVNERVKEWQKASKGAGIGQAPEEIVVTYETDSEVEPVVVQQKEIKVAKQRAPARRKSRQQTPVPDDEERGRKTGSAGHAEEANEVGRSKSAAPKKRVISDDHWMMKKKRSPKGRGTSIPKNFLQATCVNPPVEKKIEDWVKRMEEDPEPVLEKPRSRSRKVFEREVDDGARKVEDPKPIKIEKSVIGDDGIRIKPSNDRPSRPRPASTSEDGARAAASKWSLPDDGIRITPLKDRPSKARAASTPIEKDDGIRIIPSHSSRQDDGIRVRPSREPSPQSDLRIKSTRKDGSKRRPKEEDESPTPTPRKKSTQHLMPSSERETESRVTSHGTTLQDGDDNLSHVTPTPRQGSRRRKSGTPTESLDDIPFGNSAFSTIDLPLGAEANTLRKPEPKRNSSFSAVPNVLKRVYTEGKKMMQDAAEPPRGGVNQPPSIDSWLNGTVDPFVEAPAVQKGLLEPRSAPVSRKSSYQDHLIEIESDAERNDKRRKTRKRKSLEKEEPSPVEIKNQSTLPNRENTPLAPPSGLKRSPATRTTASPKSVRKMSLRDAVIDAFKGDSSVGKNDAPSPFDFIGLRERDINRVDEYRPSRELESVAEDAPPRHTLPAQEHPISQEPKVASPSFPRRLAPTTGNHRLSTIASLDTLRTGSGSSLTETSAPSELTQTTLTESILTGTTASTLSKTTASSLSQNTASSMSRNSKVSASKRSNKNDSGLKRRLTKHSDLVSMLSLPDSEVPGRGKSIKSARSIRTTRANLDTATTKDVFRELADDETKYMRELNTLVDGVIPVLLTCVLSKSDAAIAAGLFDPLVSSTGDLQTKPIVDMGIALERLKSLHRRIPLTDPTDFIRWANSAAKIYEDYIHAWRSGFEDLVVNLAPASTADSVIGDSDRDKMKLDKYGDVLKDTGERADVGYMLKRPLVRIKGLAKATKVCLLHTEKWQVLTV